MPCSDLAGEVVKVGERITDYTEGDKVIASFDLNTLYGAMKDPNHSLGGCFDGKLRQYIAPPSTALIKIPSD